MLSTRFCCACFGRTLIGTVTWWRSVDRRGTHAPRIPRQATSVHKVRRNLLISREVLSNANRPRVLLCVLPARLCDARASAKLFRNQVVGRRSPSTLQDLNGGRSECSSDRPSPRRYEMGSRASSVARCSGLRIAAISGCDTDSPDRNVTTSRGLDSSFSTASASPSSLAVSGHPTFRRRAHKHSVRRASAP